MPAGWSGTASERTTRMSVSRTASTRSSLSAVTSASGVPPRAAAAAARQGERDGRGGGGDEELSAVHAPDYAPARRRGPSAPTAGAR